MQELYAKRDELEQLLLDAIDECRRSGLKLAENEAEYRKALAVEMARARADKIPVTIASDLCRGIPYIADLKQARDSAEAVYKASQEAINVNKIRFRAVDADIQRIWNSGGQG